KDAEEIVEECVESEFSDQEEKDVESGMLDNTTLGQCGPSNVQHAYTMRDSTWPLDVGLPPCADAVQTLLNYEGLTTHQSGVHTSKSKSVKDFGSDGRLPLFRRHRYLPCLDV